ncbi:DUF6602 domain-containing protein [Epilithonimonas sp. UC225_85]|uniref:DUF6602 domain-containing protein n=1 Tax=Epilithonimonas sp. UC225_85 TaxID=3350167 RepID=UPI0036D24680
MSGQNIRRFQESITQELEVTKNRVRDLIGNRHWGEEGRYKEAILKNVIKNFLPSNMSIGTGFIVDSRNPDNISKQIDIILYDNTYPVLFSEGDFIITTLKNVKALIEVKSRLNPTTLRDVIVQFEESVSMLDFKSNYQFRLDGRYKNYRTKIFLGVFAFDFDGNVENTHIKNYLSDSDGLVNHFSLGTNIFIKKWKNIEGLNLQPLIDLKKDFYNIYEINNLSFSYFISNLMDISTGGLNDRNWFSYPIEGTKELFRKSTIEITGK